MIITDQQIKELEEAARPLIEWLNTLAHPHVNVIVDCSSAELVEGIARIVNEEYIRD